MTGTAVELAVVVPLPSWPLVFEPQQYPSPVVRTPHVWKKPALTLPNVRVPSTGKGVVLQASTASKPAHVSVVAAPSWPSPLLPQQYAAPLDVRPHACQ